MYSSKASARGEKPILDLPLPEFEGNEFKWNRISGPSLARPIGHHSIL